MARRQAGRVRRTLLVAGLALVATLGCGRTGPTAVIVSGTVTAGGRPVSGAVITFEPQADTGGPKASAGVFDGRYDIGPEAGLRGGPYRVRIAMLPAELIREVHQELPDAYPPPGTQVDLAYDTDSQLTCELKRDEPNTLNYEIEFRP